MLLQTASSSSTETWAVILAAGTLALAVATAGLGFFTWRAARAGEHEAAASRELVDETRQDRELTARPVLVAPYIDAQREDDALRPRVLLRNIGNGPAINVVVWANVEGTYFCKSGITIAPGELSPEPDVSSIPPGREPHWLDRYQGTADCSAFALDGPDQNTYAYCTDLLGNCLQFNLRRSSDPPEIWPRGASSPRWRDAWAEAGAAQPSSTDKPAARGYDA